jgi:hypothetical protein
MLYIYTCIYTKSMKTGDEIKSTRINHLIQTTPKGLVLLSGWLASEGYSYELLQRYRKGGWLKSIGKGAMVRSGDSLVLSGAITALQKQANSDLHIGGRSALELSGVAHYLQLDSEETTLFTANKSSIPFWFTNNLWDRKPKIFSATLFRDNEVGLAEYHDGELKMNISGAARATMECLSLCPNLFPLTEAYELMEGLTSLRPAQVQTLLEQCKSVKVKRLFLYFAERVGHSWFKYIDTKSIDLGGGVRSFASDGAFVSKYQMVLPKELV